MKKTVNFIILSFFIVFIISFFSCTNLSDNTMQSGSNLKNIIEDDKFTAYDIFVPDYDNIYEINYNNIEICNFKIMKSDTEDVIISLKTADFDIICFRDKSKNIYVAYSYSETEDYLNCFLKIGDDSYPYFETIEINEYNDVLNQNGFIISFMSGINYKPILYFYMNKENKMPVLLAECDKTNYEITSDNNETKKLLTNFGSITGESIIYYFIENKIYRIAMNSFIYDLFCVNNEIISINYDETKTKFTIDICSEVDFTIISTKEAYIIGNKLYIN